jgi:uncharacterized membrane protein required for colicin V production
MALGSSDYVILGVSLAAAILGMFGGFSGALAFLAGVGAAVATIRYGWNLLEARIEAPWALALAALVCALLVFGIARLIVKKTVKNILAQPADAIFGALIAAVTGFAAALAGAYAMENLLEVPVNSQILSEVLGLVA